MQVAGCNAVNYIGKQYVAPCARSSACMLIDPQDQVFVFGGQDANNRTVNDLWYMDNTCSFHYTVGTPNDNQVGTTSNMSSPSAFPKFGQLPTSRHSFACGLDYSNNLFVYGGVTFPKPPQGTLGMTNDWWTMGKYLYCGAGYFKNSLGESACTPCPWVCSMLTSAPVNFPCAVSSFLLGNLFREYRLRVHGWMRSVCLSIFSAVVFSLRLSFTSRPVQATATLATTATPGALSATSSFAPKVRSVVTLGVHCRIRYVASAQETTVRAAAQRRHLARLVCFRFALHL